MRVRYVPAPDYTATAGEMIAQRLRERMGEVDVTLEAVAQVPRSTRAGKFRAVISQVRER